MRSKNVPRYCVAALLLLNCKAASLLILSHCYKHRRAIWLLFHPWHINLTSDRSII